jgi:hypothetical protein
MSVPLKEFAQRFDERLHNDHERGILHTTPMSGLPHYRVHSLDPLERETFGLFVHRAPSLSGRAALRSALVIDLPRYPGTIRPLIVFNMLTHDTLLTEPLYGKFMEEEHYRALGEAVLGHGESGVVVTTFVITDPAHMLADERLEA